jgi:hypothetical protein
VKIEFEEYSTIEDFFLYLIATEYTPEVKHLLPVTLYKGYVFSIVPLSPLSGEVSTMVYTKGSIDAGLLVGFVKAAVQPPTSGFRIILGTKFTHNCLTLVEDVFQCCNPFI